MATTNRPTRGESTYQQPGTFNRMAEATQHTVQDHVAASTLTAFGLGVGVGIALVYLTSDHLIRQEEEGMAHRIGRQVLSAVRYAVPDALMHRGG